MLARMWSNYNSLALQAMVQDGVTFLEYCLTVSYKIKHFSILQSSHFISGYLHKES